MPASTAASTARWPWVTVVVLGLPSDGIDMTALAHIVPSLSSRICSRILAADRPTRFGTCGARVGEQ